MAHDLDTLGQRILAAARIAVDMHLAQSAKSAFSLEQRVVIGRAGLDAMVDLPASADFSTEGSLPGRLAEGAAR